VRTATDAIELASASESNRLLLRVYNQSGGLGGTRYLALATGKK